MLSSTLLALSLATLSGDKTGQPAPEIEVKSWMNIRPTSLAREAGKVVVLEFWATW